MSKWFEWAVEHEGQTAEEIIKTTDHALTGVLEKPDPDKERQRARIDGLLDQRLIAMKMQCKNTNTS